jgi:hypothetical protein
VVWSILWFKRQFADIQHVYLLDNRTVGHPKPWRAPDVKQGIRRLWFHQAEKQLKPALTPDFENMTVNSIDIQRHWLHYGCRTGTMRQLFRALNYSKAPLVLINNSGLK